MAEMPEVKNHREALFNAMKTAEDAYVECIRRLGTHTRAIVQNPVDVTPEDVGVWIDGIRRFAVEEKARYTALGEAFQAIVDHVTVDDRGVIQ